MDKRLFQWWNDCDHHLIFSGSLKNKYNSLSKSDQEIFDPEEFISAQTEKLFNKYDFIIVTPKNKIFGQKGDNIELLIEGIEDAFECAKAIK